jgi:glutamate-ammonia ligase adenylyltransferase
VGRSVLEGCPLWEVLREHTQSFDHILEQALAASSSPQGFAVFAVGRLGTCELDVLSDADLVFLRKPECDAELAGQCAQAVVGMVSGYTCEGSVIEVDTRIRPHGTEGALVPSLRQLAQYFENEAKAWESLAFGKLRWIAGDRLLDAEACEAVAALRRRFAGSAQFVSELRTVRKRIEDSYGLDSIKGGPPRSAGRGTADARAAGCPARSRVADRGTERRTAPCSSALPRCGARHPGGGGPSPEMDSGKRLLAQRRGAIGKDSGAGWCVACSDAPGARHIRFHFRRLKARDCNVGG